MINVPASPHKTRQPSGRPKDPAKYADILRAATEIFMQQGYNLTSLEAIAKLADVSKLTIYSHFSNKKDLFKSVIQHRCDTLAGPENFTAFTHMPVKTALLNLGSTIATLVYNADSLHLQRTLYSEAMHHPEIVQLFYEAGPQRVKTAFCELLQVWHMQGQLQIANFPRATDHFFSLLKGELHNSAMSFLIPIPDTATIDEHVSAVVNVFLAAYLPHSTTDNP